MNKGSLLIILFISFAIVQGCARKAVPPKPTEDYTSKSKNETIDSASVAEAPAKENIVYRAPVKTATPKVIVVNDKAATKTVEGRYYYDLQGKRYWRNKKDGKYYLYYKGMFNNKDFQ